MYGWTLFVYIWVLFDGKATRIGDFMTTESHQHAPDLELIGKLEKEVDRIKQSQKVMRAANRALRTGNDGVLRDLKFSDEHIAELKQRVDAGLDGFPPYVFRNNKNAVENIKRNMNHINSQIRCDLTSNGDECRSADPVDAKFEVNQACDVDAPSRRPLARS